MADSVLTEWVGKFEAMKPEDQKKALKKILTKKSWMDGNPNGKLLTESEEQAAMVFLLSKSFKKTQEGTDCLINIKDAPSEKKEPKADKPKKAEPSKAISPKPTSPKPASAKKVTLPFPHISKKESQGSIFDRLTDPSLYTGAHKERFDADGKGKGLAGRDSVAKGNGYVHGGGAVIAKAPIRTNTEKKSSEVPKKRPKTPTREASVESDSYCMYSPSYGCSVTDCKLKCLHCGTGYCTACLWGASGKMKALDKCAKCGKKPGSLPTEQRPGWQD